MENNEKEIITEEVPKKKKKKKSVWKIIRNFFLILICLAIFIGSVGVLLYPMISNMYSDQMQSQVRTAYEKKLAEIDESEFVEAKRLADEYNAVLAGVTTEAFSEEYLESLRSDYNKLLNLTGDGLMGYVEVPIINVYLPVYHGNTGNEVDDAAALEQGVVHLFGTSPPVGGKNTHAAMSAHTGMANNKLFTDLEALKEGDVFYLHVLNETLAYEVCNIAVVEPYDTSLLGVYKGQDYVTLITCTPYGVNSHRLLVRGTRIPYEEAKKVEVVQHETREVTSQWNKQYMKGILYGLGLVVSVLLILILVHFLSKKMKEKMKEEEAKETEEVEEDSENSEQTGVVIVDGTEEEKEDPVE